MNVFTDYFPVTSMVCTVTISALMGTRCAWAGLKSGAFPGSSPGFGDGSRR